MGKVKISVSLPEEAKKRIDEFVENNPRYRDRSDFVQQAAEHEMKRDYEVLRQVQGSWSDETAEQARQRIKERRKKDIQEREERHDSRQ
jgi:Arc/MetJ-type ribon-helix-helix transcriptional regulator